MSTSQRPPSASLTNGAAFKMMSISGNICPRCSKTVYSAEEVKAAGKVCKKTFLVFHFIILFVLVIS
jgi:CxxC motif-containing protein